MCTANDKAIRVLYKSSASFDDFVAKLRSRLGDNVPSAYRLAVVLAHVSNNNWNLFNNF